MPKKPDLTPLVKASESIGSILKKGDIVVYESTVYPGATEEVCVPILAKQSGLKPGDDFKVGYSPERINPGDKEHGFKQIVKVVSGEDDDSLSTIANVYGSVVDAGIHKASSIKVAEAAKVIENTQRDLNIALMNEISLIFDKMDISTTEVLEAAKTKWNFLPFTPGLVGGHCIGVDPYYLTHKAEKLGYHPEVILSGRRINDNMGKFIAQKAIKLIAGQGKSISNSKVAILGITFKEDCPDTRNTKVINIIDELKSFGINPEVCDPCANKGEVLQNYGIELTDFKDLCNVDCLIAAVKHKSFLELDEANFRQILANKSLGIDIKGILPKNIFDTHWLI